MSSCIWERKGFSGGVVSGRGSLVVHEIEVSSELYRQEVELRDEILRKPIGLKLLERIEEEAACRHFGLVDAEVLVACLIVVPWGEEMVQIRQMAVRTDRQGTGLGRRLMEEVEIRIRTAGIRHVFLNARVTAIGFYESLGYREVGDCFTEVGIPHQRMEKLLP